MPAALQVTGPATQMRVQRLRALVHWCPPLAACLERVCCRGLLAAEPAVPLARSVAARKNLPAGPWASSAAKHLHPARAQMVAPPRTSPVLRVSVLRALRSPMSRARSVVVPSKSPPGPEILPEQSAAVHLRLARLQMAAPWRSLEPLETAWAVLRCPVAQV